MTARDEGGAGAALAESPVSLSVGSDQRSPALEVTMPSAGVEPPTGALSMVGGSAAGLSPRRRPRRLVGATSSGSTSA